MWQFFGQYGASGLIGLLIALALLSFVGAVTFLQTRQLGRTETDLLIVRKDIPLLRWAVVILEALFLFSVCIIMTSGVGALCQQLFGLPAWLGCALFTAVVTIVSFAGLTGMITAFSATVPVLVAATLVFGLRFLLHGMPTFQPLVQETANPLLRFWPIAAVLFTCYNVFGSIAILSPMGLRLRSNGALLGGIAIGAVILLLVALSVLVSVCAAGTQGAELPMLALALEISRPVGWCYGFLLLLAMFGTCLSCLVAFTRVIGERFPVAVRFRVPFHLLCAVAIFCGSLFGFGDLIGVVYPIFGYCSSVFVVMLVVCYFRVRRGKAAGKCTNAVNL